MISRNIKSKPPSWSSSLLQDKNRKHISYKILESEQLKHKRFHNLDELHPPVLKLGCTNCTNYQACYLREARVKLPAAVLCFTCSHCSIDLLWSLWRSHRLWFGLLVLWGRWSDRRRSWSLEEYFGEVFVLQGIVCFSSSLLFPPL